MFKSLLKITPVLVAASLLVGCATHQESEEYCKSVKPGEVKSVNTMCAIVNDDPVDPAVKTVTFRGQEVGFCCQGCVPKWEKLTDDQKAEALAKALAKSKK